MNNIGIYYSAQYAGYAQIDIQKQEAAYYVPSHGLLDPLKGWSLRCIDPHDWIFLCFQDELEDKYPELFI